MSLGFIVKNSKENTATTNITTKQINVVVESNEEIEIIGARNNIWFIGSIIFSVLSSLSFLGITYTMYDPIKSYIAPSLFGVGLAIATIQWFQTMLSMRLFSTKVPPARWSALSLYILASLCFLSSSFAVMEQNSTFQFLTSLTGAVIGWIAFTVVFEGEFVLPSRQQVAALFQILILSFLWELRTYIVNQHFS